jgi:uncharacterized protein (DUF1697 family)
MTLAARPGMFGQTGAMGTHVVLLRAVNLGGKNRIQMPAFRATLEGLGFRDVVTYIQSGNAVFDCKERSPTRLTNLIETALESQFGTRIGVVVRSASEFTEAVAANPYLGRAENSALHVPFLDRKPDATRLRTIDAAKYAPEEFAPGAHEVYLHLPNGVGRSKLALAIGPKLAPAVATMRNWNTATKLVELATR